MVMKLLIIHTITTVRQRENIKIKASDNIRCVHDEKCFDILQWMALYVGHSVVLFTFRQKGRNNVHRQREHYC